VARLLIVFLTILFSMSASFGDMWERTVSRLIRAEGFWCEVVSDIRPAVHLKKGDNNPVLVTCDDGARFEQYLLVFDANDKLVSITKK